MSDEERVNANDSTDPEDIPSAEGSTLQKGQQDSIRGNSSNSSDSDDG